MTGEIRPTDRIETGLWFTVALLGVVGVVVASYLGLEASATSTPPTTIAEVATLTGEAIDSGTATTGTTAPVTTEGQPVTTEGQPVEPEVDLDCPPLFGLRFAIGSASFDPASVEQHAAVVNEWMVLHPEASLVVEGHADSTGSEQTNLALSYRRAESVAAALVAGGVPESSLNVRGLGEYQVMVGEPSDSERNRRVTMRVPGYESCPLEDIVEGGS